MAPANPRFLKILAEPRIARLRQRQRRERASASAICLRMGSRCPAAVSSPNACSVFAHLREHGEGDRAADCPAWPRSTTHLSRVRTNRRTLSRRSSTNFACMTATRSKHRWGGACRVGFSPGRLAAANRRIFRRLADAHCAGETAACRNQTFCCSTNRRTIWISNRATGWKNISSNYPFAFVLISHDRYFLDVTVNRIVEIWNKKIWIYSGNYEKYLSQKDSATGAARSRVQKPARTHRATRSLHQSFSLSGHQGQAGAKPHQRAGEDRAHRAAGRREDDSFFFSAAEAQRPDCRGVQGSCEELRTKASLSGCEFHRSRRATALRWSE